MDISDTLSFTASNVAVQLTHQVAVMGMLDITWADIKRIAKLAVGIARDEIIYEAPIQTMARVDFFTFQLRRRRNGGQYVTLKLKGGEATVWVGLNVSEARELARHLDLFVRANTTEDRVEELDQINRP